MSITTGALFRKTIDTIADGSTYRKPTIDEISKLKTDGNFIGDIYESTGNDKIIDAISSYIMSVSTGDTLFDLNPSGSADASLENILLFGAGGRIFLSDQTLDFINASGTEIIGRGIRVWESDSKYAKLAYEGGSAILEVVGGDITGGRVKTVPYTALTATLSENDTTAFVDNTLGFSSSGACYISNVYGGGGDGELFTYTGTTDTSFTGLSIGRDDVYDSGTPITVSGQQGVIMDGTTNSLHFYDDTNKIVVRIDDNIYGSGVPGIEINEGTIRIEVDEKPANLISGQLHNSTQSTSGTHAVYIENLKYNTSSGHVHIAIAGHSYSTNSGDHCSHIGVRGSTLERAYDCGDCIGVLARNVHTSDHPSNRAFGLVSESGGSRNFRLRHYDTPTSDFVDFEADTSGYLNITPNGDRIRIRESARGASSYFDLYADTDGFFNIRPVGDKLLLWESAQGTGDVTHLWTDDSGYFNIRPLGSDVAEAGIVRLWDRAGGSGDYADLYSDLDGYFNIKPAGDVLRLLESAGGSNYTDFWTDGSGDLNIRPQGDDIKIWESAGGANHWGSIASNTSGILVLDSYASIVYVPNNLNVGGTYRMDGSDIINTSAQQTGSFITRTYVSFGRDANLTRTNPGSTTADAATVDGSLNLQGYRMIRAGVVTGISGQFITSARTSDDTITFTVQKNGVNQSMVATKTITGIGGTGCISTANSFSVVAEDTVNVEMTLTAGDVGTVTIANIAIAVEMLI